MIDTIIEMIVFFVKAGFALYVVSCLIEINYVARSNASKLDDVAKRLDRLEQKGGKK